MTGHTDRVTSVAWSPDGRRLASGDVEAKIHILPVGFAQQTPCGWLVGSNLSLEQWGQYRGYALYRPTCENLATPEIPFLSVDYFVFTSAGRLLLLGVAALILRVDGLGLWTGFKVARWGLRQMRRR